jgi:hypothetical protein
MSRRPPGAPGKGLFLPILIQHVALGVVRALPWKFATLRKGTPLPNAHSTGRC